MTTSPRKKAEKPKAPLKRPPAADLVPPPVPPSISGRGKRTHPGGVPEHVPTEQLRNTVSLAMFAGYTQTQTARLIGIDEKTLARHYESELSGGAEKIGAMVARNLIGIAAQSTDRKAQLTALIFLAKTRLRWRERDVVEAEAKVSAGDGDRVTVTLRIGDRESED